MIIVTDMEHTRCNFQYTEGWDSSHKIQFRENKCWKCGTNYHFAKDRRGRH